MTLIGIKKFIINNYCWFILSVIVFLASLFIIFYYFKTNQDFVWEYKISHNYSEKAQRFLDGKLVDKDTSSLKPIGIILENHFESRPAAGLEYASIIYETVVEGDITRFLAIFDYNSDVKKIGPIRSARPFFVDLAKEYNLVLFHAGGSDEALALLKKSEILNINEISSDGIYFWRDKERFAPHNLFTSFDLIKRAIEAKNVDLKAEFFPWRFKNDEPAKDIFNLVAEIEVDFSNNPLYEVKYIYNEKDNKYSRYLNGNVHKTERGIILKAKNIVIQHVNYQIIDDYGRLKIDLFGEGEAQIYQDGIKIEGFWKKEGLRTYFYENSGQKVKFNRGTIWVELLFD